MFIKTLNVYKKPVVINTDFIVTAYPDSDPESCWISFSNDKSPTYFNIPFEEVLNYLPVFHSINESN